MSAIGEVAVVARGGSGVVGSRLVRAVELAPGMTIVLPYREFWLPWRVLGEPIPWSRVSSIAMLRRILGPGTLGAPVAVRFGRSEMVEVLPRHHGVCCRCGALSPCVDQWVESVLPPFVDGVSGPVGSDASSDASCGTVAQGGEAV